AKVVEDIRCLESDIAEIESRPDDSIQENHPTLVGKHQSYTSASPGEIQQSYTSASPDLYIIYSSYMNQIYPLPSSTYTTSRKLENMCVGNLILFIGQRLTNRKLLHLGMQLLRV
ncbi:hypothetical protein Tco_0235187, partial [Tanacetum coccineum]